MQLNTQNLARSYNPFQSSLTKEDRAFIDRIVGSISSELEAFIAQAFHAEKGNLISLESFYDQLVRHDWYYFDSDDYRVREAAREDRARLNCIAATHIDFENLLNGFIDWSVRQYHSAVRLEHPVCPVKTLVIKYLYVHPVKEPYIFVECPRGCNGHQIPASQVYDECGACGSRMEVEDFEEENI